MITDVGGFLDDTLNKPEVEEKDCAGKKKHGNHVWHKQRFLDTTIKDEDGSHYAIYVKECMFCKAVSVQKELI